jgi:hypothetical protein
VIDLILRALHVAVAVAVLMAIVEAPIKAVVSTQQPGERIMKHAKGTFEVKIAPAETSALGKEAGMGRLTIDKVFAGELEGTSKGEMLTGMTESTGAMAYVAIERVTGKVDDHAGSFILMHNATMNKNDPKSSHLQVVVVPGSGTEGLGGLTGTLTINIDGAGKHSYDFEYELP